MLKEIYCDRFIYHGKPRGRIQLHYGLNTVVGSKTGTNSIGKSTSLLVIDFAFGGMDYIKVPGARTIFKHLGNHTICFEFEFNKTAYYFSRLAAKEDTGLVNICDQDYNVLKTEPLTKFCEWLKDQYGIDYPYVSFREYISTFERIYGRDNLNEYQPMELSSKEKNSVSIDRLLKVYGLYGPIQPLREKESDITKRKTTLSNASKYGYIPAIPNKTTYKQNATEISASKNELNCIAEKSDKGLLELSSEKAAKLSELKSELSSFNRQRTTCKNKIDAILKDDSYLPEKFQRDMNELKKFFPNEEFCSITDLEEFHIKLKKILKGERADALNDLKAYVSILDSKIHDIEVEIAEIGSYPNVSKLTLQSYADLSTKVTLLSSSNEVFERFETASSTLNEVKKNISVELSKVVNQLQQSINDELEKFSDFLSEGLQEPPRIEIISPEKYEFYTEDDSGTGTNYTGLILFDLSALWLTKVPFVTHDSFLLKQLGDTRIEKLLSLYNKSNEINKQVFISMDKETAYSEESKMEMERTKVLTLDEDGGELFGESWNKKPEPKAGK